MEHTHNREAWLTEALAALRPTIDAAASEFGTATVPELVRVACGWPSRAALSRKQQRLGEAWHTKCSADGAAEIFISPVLADAAPVLDVLVHELVHTMVPEAGHKRPFKQIAVAVGLEGKMTATHAGDELRALLEGLAEDLGPYPHACLNATPRAKKQGTRMLKVECPACGCVARMTAKWLEAVGPPTCGCGTAMDSV